MADDVGSVDVGQDETESRKRRRGPLPLILLVILILIILWLLWQFLGNLPVSNKITLVKTRTIDVTSPIVPEPVLPPQAVGSDNSARNGIVPNVVGRSLASAVITLENAGYVVSVTYVYSDSTPAGIVVGQNPDGGTALQTGGVVTLVVSRGNGDIPLVTMPNCIGLTQSAAEAKVRAAGLRPYLLHGTMRAYAGRIGTQWPPAGSKLPKGGEGFIQLMIRR